jgi:hypothetical protein
LLNEPAAAQELARHGISTIRARHTCAHRVDELLQICHELEIDTSPEVTPDLATGESPLTAAMYPRPENTS